MDIRGKHVQQTSNSWCPGLMKETPAAEHLPDISASEAGADLARMMIPGHVGHKACAEPVLWGQI